jgi:hypothetical protein
MHNAVIARLACWKLVIAAGACAAPAEVRQREQPAAVQDAARDAPPITVPIPAVRCWRGAPQSGVYALPEVQYPRRGYAVAIVDGCVGVNAGATGLDEDGALAFGGSVRATGERLWKEVLLAEGVLSVRDARESRGIKTIDDETALVITETIDASTPGARLALLEHPSAAVRAAAIERLLPEQGDAAICGAITSSAIRHRARGSRDDESVRRLTQALRGACAVELLRRVGGDPHWADEAARALRPAVRSGALAEVLLDFVDRVVAASTRAGPVHPRTASAAYSLLPEHPERCGDTQRPRTALDCLSEPQARDFVAQLEARLERVEANAGASELLLGLIQSFLGARRASLHWLGRERVDCALRTTALRTLGERVVALTADEVERTFALALSKRFCAAARERAGVLLAFRLSSTDGDERAWRLLAAHIRAGSSEVARLQELRDQFTRTESCLSHVIGRTAAAEEVRRSLGLERCL